MACRVLNRDKMLENVDFWRCFEGKGWFLHGFGRVFYGAQKRAFLRSFLHSLTKVNFYDVKRHVFLQNLCRHVK